jgi:hypothetical protein
MSGDAIAHNSKHKPLSIPMIPTCYPQPFHSHPQNST